MRRADVILEKAASQQLRNLYYVPNLKDIQFSAALTISYRGSTPMIYTDLQQIMELELKDMNLYMPQVTVYAANDKTEIVGAL